MVLGCRRGAARARPRPLPPLAVPTRTAPAAPATARRRAVRMRCRRAGTRPRARRPCALVAASTAVGALAPTAAAAAAAWRRAGPASRLRPRRCTRRCPNLCRCPSRGRPSTPRPPLPAAAPGRTAIRRHPLRRAAAASTRRAGTEPTSPCRRWRHRRAATGQPMRAARGKAASTMPRSAAAATVRCAHALPAAIGCCCGWHWLCYPLRLWQRLRLWLVRWRSLVVLRCGLGVSCAVLGCDLPAFIPAVQSRQPSARS